MKNSHNPYKNQTDWNISFDKNPYLKNKNLQTSTQKDHSQYFQKLQEQLLQKSNRYTSLIGTKYSSKLSTSQQVSQINQVQNQSYTNRKNQIKKVSISNNQNKSYPVHSQQTTIKNRQLQIDYKNADEMIKSAKKLDNQFYQNYSLTNLHKQLDLLCPKNCISRQGTQRSAFQPQNDGQIISKFNNQIYKNSQDNKQNIRENISIKLDHIKAIINSYNSIKRIQCKQQNNRKQLFNRNLAYHLPFQKQQTHLPQFYCDKKQTFISSPKVKMIHSPLQTFTSQKQQSIILEKPSFILERSRKQTTSSKKQQDKYLKETISTKISVNNHSSIQSSKLSQNCHSSQNVKHPIKSLLNVPDKLISASQNKKIKDFDNLQVFLKNQTNQQFSIKNKYLSPTNKFARSSIKERIVKKQMSIQDFHIIVQIGEGKIGKVFMARHIVSNFICALKIINRQILNEYLVVQIQRQIKIQYFLDHPNIVQLYAFFSDQQNIYLMMELCVSGNLYTYLKKERSIAQKQIKLLIRQVCNALQYMHDNEIIHRDLKPQNILFHQKVIKVCDFGWSVHSPLPRDTLCGTPIYASPELVQKKKYNNKIDVWNVGILTFELLYGRVPFEIRSQEDLAKVVYEDIHYPKFTQISKQCKHFIESCVNKTPQKRNSISQLLEHPFLSQKT